MSRIIFFAAAILLTLSVLFTGVRITREILEVEGREVGETLEPALTMVDETGHPNFSTRTALVPIDRTDYSKRLGKLTSTPIEYEIRQCAAFKIPIEEVKGVLAATRYPYVEHVKIIVDKGLALVCVPDGATVEIILWYALLQQQEN